MAKDYVEELLSNAEYKSKIELALAQQEDKIRKAISAAILANRLLVGHQVARETASYIALNCKID